MRLFAIAAATFTVAVGAPVGALAAVAPTFRMSIVHVVRGCHIWQTHSPRSASTTITVRRGTRVVIRLTCPMDFEFRQLSGPRLALGAPRSVAGTTRTIAFPKPGVYKLVAKNIQSSSELGLETLGSDHTLALTVRVR